jgi:pimeloyl-ACP methyl ester carboxylesterase
VQAFLPSIDAWRARGHFVPFRAYRVFCIDSAPHDQSLPVLVLVHGFPTSSWDFAKVWPALAARFRLIALDMLGFGFSSKPHNHRYSIMEQADLVEAVIESCGAGPHHILAHDYGDTVTQELLARDNARAPRQLLSVCFLNGGLFPETHRARLIQKMLEGPLGPVLSRLTNKSAFERSMTAIFGPDTPPSAEEIDGFWELATLENGHRLAHELIRYMEDRRVNRERWVGAMCDAQCPLAVIDGAVDPVSGAHMVKRYREVVGTGYIAELDGIGHYPQVEAPELVLEHYSRFLEGAGFGRLAPGPAAA